ncbi:Glycoside-hydrolase family GH114 [Salegentibacter holothuriorum]|uniref:Glycoside-hydrolase family GH114 n=1 Tax=Salegentibacter holothuriorum TaxID=241145 RepID=A0A1T5AIC5_9FLAO|nr:endo alpha-1,4 polygalactosaminidase [Salegentibacter holothuriorum]SKB34744.1 Glycoside-hydrolase family GH114 [Salegentibacter holothuriorum]
MITGAILLQTAQAVAQQLTKEKQVLFTYGDFYPKDVFGYEIVVLESAHFDSDDIRVLKQQNNTVLGYISLGEVNESAAHFPQIKNYSLGKNEIWNSHILDIENEETRESLMNIFNFNMKKGLDGMFLDNIDNYTIFGPTPGKKQALLDFLKTVKIVFPDIYLMQNAGVSIIEDTHPYINSVAKESVVTNYDFKTNKYQLREAETFLRLLNELKNAYKDYKIPVILIEYADTEKLKKAIDYRLQENNWPYFIGKVDLQSIPDKN